MHYLFQAIGVFAVCWAVGAGLARVLVAISRTPTQTPTNDNLRDTISQLSHAPINLVAESAKMSEEAIKPTAESLRTYLQWKRRQERAARLRRLKTWFTSFV